MDGVFQVTACDQTGTSIVRSPVGYRFGEYWQAGFDVLKLFGRHASDDVGEGMSEGFPQHAGTFLWMTSHGFIFQMLALYFCWPIDNQ